MAALNELVRSLYNPNNAETADFGIFMKPKLEVHDHYRLWLRVLQDHMIFIIKRSKLYDEKAGEFLARLTQLKEQVMNGSPGDMPRFNEEVIQIVEIIHEFKRTILAGLLSGPPQILLPPTFLSHMLNELEKFRFMIYYFKANGTLPPVNRLNDHELWLSDIAGHLGSIHDNLDPTEKLIRMRLHDQKKVFKALHHKALEFINYVKHGVVGGRHIDALTDQSVISTLAYLNLVNEIRQLRESNEALGVVDRHMLLHMIIEEVYYLKTLPEGVNSFDPLAAFQMPFDLKSLDAISLIPR